MCNVYICIEIYVVLTFRGNHRASNCCEQFLPAVPNQKWVVWCQHQKGDPYSAAPSGCRFYGFFDFTIAIHSL